MTDSRFSLSMPDASGNEVKLELMPRTHFPGLGWQAGVRITTTLPDGETAIANTIGLSDEDRVAFAVALYNEGPLS